MPTPDGLATRTEDASGNDRALFEEAFRAVIGAPSLYGSDSASMLWPRFIHLLDAEAYIDATLTLLPEGWCFEFAHCDESWAVVHEPAEPHAMQHRGEAATPALALLAACIRAHDGRGKS